ncbi:hypothetical protein BCHO_3001 [Bifidobacterium choerinum]|uniref:Uncharacterized protein n=1 Tax=Bifidobacterium choerinum TaxID=35760 RepID=A0A087ADF7_9BIFI|nr:hypothetical protein BCHO_3001 [Bifidobacterium choerinum]
MNAHRSCLLSSSPARAGTRRRVCARPLVMGGVSGRVTKPVASVAVDRWPDTPCMRRRHGMCVMAHGTSVGSGRAEVQGERRTMCKCG